MRNEAHQWLTLGGLVVLTVAMMFAGYKLAGLDGRIADALQTPPDRRMYQAPDCLSSNVTNKAGVTITVTTCRRQNQDGTWETDAELLARHLAMVDLVANSGG